MRRSKLIDIEADDGTLLSYAYHANGDGLVETAAEVGPRARIDDGVRVPPGAKVDADTHVGAKPRRHAA